jgi:heme-degrading monooxygenase HmoA
MFARTVRMQLKPGSLSEFTQLMEQEVIPLLRKQHGFTDEIAFVRPNGTVAIGVTLWDAKESADAYQRGLYPEVLKALASVVDGIPRVRSFEVSNSTYHKIGAR